MISEPQRAHLGVQQADGVVPPSRRSGTSWSRPARPGRRSGGRRCRARGRISCSTTRRAGLGRLPGRFRAGEAAADDVDGRCASSARRTPRHAPLEVARGTNWAILREVVRRGRRARRGGDGHCGHPGGVRRSRRAAAKAVGAAGLVGGLRRRHGRHGRHPGRGFHQGARAPGDAQPDVARETPRDPQPARRGGRRLLPADRGLLGGWRDHQHGGGARGAGAGAQRVRLHAPRRRRAVADAGQLRAASSSTPSPRRRWRFRWG